MMNGNIASSAGPKRSKLWPGSSSNIHHSRDISRQGSTSSIARVRWSRRSWVSTRPATATVIRGLMRGPCGGASAASAVVGCSCHALRPVRSTRVRKASSMSAAPASASTRAGVSSAITRPSRISSSRSQRSASSMTWLETRTVVPASASRWNIAQRSRRSTGSRPTVGSSRTSTSGWPSRATARLTRERWPPLRLPTTWPPDRARSTAAMLRSTSLGAGAEHPGEEAEVLGDAQVVVHAGGLGDVADPVPQRPAAGRLPEDA